MLEPDSGIYINDEPGFSLKAIDANANEEQMTYKGAWVSIVATAKRAFIDSIKTAMMNRYVWQNKLNNQLAGRYTSVMQPILDGSSYALQLTFPYTIDMYYGIFIEYLQIMASFDTAETDNIQVKIYDETTGNLLFSKDYSGDVSMGTRTLKIGRFLNPSIGTNGIIIDIRYNAGDEYTITQYYNIGNSAINFISGSYNTDTGIFTESNSGTNGILVSCSLGCSIELFICQNLTALTNAWLYQLCLTALEFRRHERQLNKWSITEKDNEVLYEKYSKQRKSELELFFKSYNFDESKCWMCNEQMKMNWTQP